MIYFLICLLCWLPIGVLVMRLRNHMGQCDNVTHSAMGVYFWPMTLMIVFLILTFNAIDRMSVYLGRLAGGKD